MQAGPAIRRALTLHPAVFDGLAREWRCFYKVAECIEFVRRSVQTHVPVPFPFRPIDRRCGANAESLDSRQSSRDHSFPFREITRFVHRSSPRGNVMRCVPIAAHLERHLPAAMPRSPIHAISNRLVDVPRRQASERLSVKRGIVRHIMRPLILCRVTDGSNDRLIPGSAHRARTLHKPAMPGLQDLV